MSKRTKRLGYPVSDRNSRPDVGGRVTTDCTTTPNATKGAAFTAGRFILARVADMSTEYNLAGTSEKIIVSVEASLRNTNDP